LFNILNSFCLLGIDKDGKGVVYHYDPVGHMEKDVVTCGGTSAPLIQPFLDNQVTKIIILTDSNNLFSIF
jgi:20S proteasome alpha/beta subunit